MTEYNHNLAYDLSMFDEEEQSQKLEQRRKEEQKLRMSKAKSVAKSGSVFKTMFTVTIAAVMAFSLLYSKVNLSELTIQISAESTELELAERENIRLQANLDNMVTLNKVEESASSDLGLQKTQKSQVKYITKDSESMAEIAAEDENVFVSIQEWFYGVLEYLGF